MRRRDSSLWLLCAVCAGCVDGFRGSNIQVDLSPATPVQASPGTLPRPGQLPANAHYKLYGVELEEDGEHLYELQRFEVHRIVDVASPCFIDAGEHVPHPGLHVTQYGAQIGLDVGIPDYRNPPPGASDEAKIAAATAAQRMANVAALAGDMGIKAVTSASTGGYPAVAADCTGSPSELPPPSCTDAASNARRLELCRAAWSNDPALWEGTDRVLTSPLAGTTYGMVVGLNPVSHAPVGGATFSVDRELSVLDAYAIYWQLDGDDAPGTLVFYGIPARPTRGVTHVHMTSPLSPMVTAELAIFEDLGEDEVSF